MLDFCEYGDRISGAVNLLVNYEYECLKKDLDPAITIMMIIISIIISYLFIYVLTQPAKVSRRKETKQTHTKGKTRKLV
jgi:uncharacterized membrane protein